MTNWLYPTAFKSWGPEEGAAVRRVVMSDRFTMGPEVAAFEREFADWHGRAHGIMVNSGSSANLVAVAAAGGQQYEADDGFLRYEGGARHRVVVPAIAWATTYAPFWQQGYDLVLADVDPSWNAGWGSEDFAPMIDMIVGCSILGNPADLGKLRRFCDRSDRILIEDNCEALGARVQNGRLCGTFGHLSTFSFFHSHQLSAAEGGMILTDDDELARLCRLLRDHGNAGWGNEDFDRSYDFVLMGYNLRPVEMHAAIAREQLRKLPRFIGARRANLEHFLAETRNLFITPQRTTGQPSPFGLAFTVDAGRDARRRLALELRAAGIDCRLPTGGSFTRHPYGEPWRDQPTPVADRIHDTGMFLGNAPYDIRDLIDQAVAVMRRVL